MYYAKCLRSQKSKKREREDNDDDGLEDKLKVKQNKKRKLTKTAPSIPGRYVLLNPPTNEESEDIPIEDNVIDTTDLIVRLVTYLQRLKNKLFSFL